jgi:DNA-3-methyladenine glycosylase
MKPSFFDKSTLEVAKSLLGKYLVHSTAAGRIVGRIVETEGYLQDDPASHSYRGKTLRNASMFGRAGTSYVYLTYGMYHCFNIVTNKEGIGEAVLIRAIEPISGLSLMKHNRKKVKVHELCSGPGRLTIAFGITKELDGIDLLHNRLTVRNSKFKTSICQGPRIGISKGTELPYRFWVKDNRFVSRSI